MKPVFKNKWEEMKPKKGTIHTMLNEEDKAKQARAQEVELKNIIKKYGILPNGYLNINTEPLYLDMTETDVSIAERLRRKEEIDKYFDKMPALIRENYHHNKEEFYQKIVNGDFNQLLKDNVITQQYIDSYNQKKFEKDNQIKKLNEQISNLQTQVQELNKNQEVIK